MNSKIVNSVICISESQKNPKRYENLSMCKQYAKEEEGCNVKDVFKFQPTVKLEVQLRHRLPPSLERSGKGGGRRWKPGFGSSGNTK